MTQYVLISLDTGEVALATLRNGPPEGVANGAQGYVIAKGTRSFKWLPVAANTLQAWQSDGDWPATVALDAADVRRAIISTSLADWKARRLGQLRAEAGRRIEGAGAMPLFKQINMMAEALTTGQTSEVAQAWSDVIDPVRQASNAAEEAIAASATHAEVEAAYAGVDWP